MTVRPHSFSPHYVLFPFRVQGLISNLEANVTVPLPAEVAALYRPDSPIAAVYGQFLALNASAESPGDLTMLLFFPLPNSISGLSPNPSLHILSATPYWSSRQLFAGSDDLWYATDERLNWTDTTLVDTGVVPYARGAAALFDDSINEGKDQGGQSLSVGNGVDSSMPRAWTPLLLVGKDQGRVVVVYQDSDFAIQIADVVGGNGKYQVVNY
jgi:hypothetical protein